MKPLRAHSSSPEIPLANDPALGQLMQMAHRFTGVQLEERHKEMLISRMHKRLGELSLPNLTSYLDYFKTHEAQEMSNFISLVTTHHTYFFREFSHFEYLVNKALPSLIPVVRARGDKKIRVWSAACSRGQEAYSLAMFLDLHLKRLAPDLSFEIFGTDVDPESIAIAKNAVYSRNELKEVPLALLGNHWIRGTGEIADFVKAKSTLRERCHFEVGNLFKLESFSPPKPFDLIFCRNVFIYFNNTQTKTISQNLLKHLNPFGFFFVGISESLSQLALPVKSLGPSIYTHTANATPEPKPTSAVPTPSTSPTPQMTAKPIRVFCVDDSGSIITLLKRLLVKENGFEVIGTAANGKIASELIPSLKPDIVTLDIHMPEMTGIEYLQGFMKPGHPPVVMITSVSREDSDLAAKALELGASDFVEKPSLNNLTERGEEIRSKLKVAFEASHNKIKVDTTLDRSFQSTQKTDFSKDALIGIAFQFTDRARVRNYIREWGLTPPPMMLIVSGANAGLGSLAPLLTKDLGKEVMVFDPKSFETKSGIIYLLSDTTGLSQTLAKGRKTSVVVLGQTTEPVAREILKLNEAQLILEDLGGGKGTPALHDVASDIVPVTSFTYIAQNYLARKK